jgi:hypothetical protein
VVAPWPGYRDHPRGWRGHDLGHGLIGTAMAAWSALALVGLCEYLTMIIRSDQVPGAATASRAGPDPMPGASPLEAQAVREFAARFQQGTCPEHVSVASAYLGVLRMSSSN